MACQYFGKAQWRGVLVNVTGSNRCALITEAHSPCIMLEPDEKVCPRCAHPPKLWKVVLLALLCTAGGAAWGQMSRILPLRLWLAISGVIWLAMVGWAVFQIRLMRRVERISKGLRWEADQLRMRITKAPYQ